MTAAMATGTAIATKAMAMATATARRRSQLLVRGHLRDVGLWGVDDLSPLFWFLRSAHCALRLPLVMCFYNYGQTPPAVGPKRFAPAPGKTTLFSCCVLKLDLFRTPQDARG